MNNVINKPHIALYEPRIPQNTGNIARSCAAFNLRLELIKPLGFELDDKYLKRAGLDYWKYMDIVVHQSFEDFLLSNKNTRIIGFSKSAKLNLDEYLFNTDDILLFGREDLGLPTNIRNSCTDIVSIRMPGGTHQNNGIGVRSLNLSVSCGIVIYKACEQLKLLY